MVTIFSDTRGVTGQTVNYFCPFLKGADFPIRDVHCSNTPRDGHDHPISATRLAESLILPDQLHVPLCTTGTQRLDIGVYAVSETLGELGMC